MANLHHKPDGWLSSLVSPPETPLIATADMKAWLRVTSSAEDAVIAGLVQAATDYLDAENGILGRALITQQWRLSMPVFPSEDHIHLPVPKVQQVVSFNYYDADNSQTAFTDYTLIVNDEATVIELNAGVSWPATYDRPDAVSIVYDTGYGDAPSDVPQAIRTAAMLLAGQWYENRQASADKAYSALPFGVRDLLMNYRLVRGHI